MGEDKFLNSERRRFPRLKDNIFIFGKLSSTSSGEFKAVTRNISAGGLLFETDRNIPKKSKLEMEIYQPLDRDKRVIFSIPVWLKVSWVKKIVKEKFEQGENRYRIGLEFLKIKDDDRERITKFISESIE